MPHHHIPELVKTGGDIVAASATVGSILTWLPSWAAAFTIIWTGMRMFDWIETKIEKRRAKKKRDNA